MATSGKLKVYIVQAKLTRDTETFGKMDPYVIISTRQQRVRTKTANNQGKTPSWPGEFIDIDVKYVGDDMLLQVFDEDVTNSDIIGENNIKLSALCVNGGIDDWFTIQHKGKEAGKVNLRAEWHPTGQQLQQRNPAEVYVAPQVTYTNGQPAMHNAINVPPPAFYAPAGQYPPQTMGYPPQQPHGYPPQQPMGYPPQQQQYQQPPTGYPQQPPTGYPQQQPAGYPPQQQPMGYPPQQQPMGYPPQQQQYQQPAMGYQQQQPMGYPPQQPPMGYPQQQQMGYPQQPVGYPPQQQQMGYPPQQQQMGYAPQQQVYGQPQMGFGQPTIVVHSAPPTQPIYFTGTQRSFVFRMGMPHVKPQCWKCNSTHINYKKMRPCKYCVCEKCGGDGFIEQKGRVCDHMHVKH